MAQRKFRLHDGKKGSALGIRVTPRATRNEIAEILHNGTIRIRLKSPPTEEEINQELASFLSSILNVPVDSIEVVAGKDGRDKLVSIIDMDTSTAHQKIIENLS